MEKDYRFKLTPAYCLYNGTAVMEQDGACIKFLVENPGDKVLQERLRKAFVNYLEFVIGHKNCPEKYRRLPQVEFEKGNRVLLRKYVSRLYESEGWYEGKNDQTKELPHENEAAAVLLLDKLIVEGRAKKATDIHIEGNTVRMRVQGRLETVMKLMEDKARELVQRIKLLSGMNVIEKRKCQDGNFTYGKENPVFLRVSTMPVVGTNIDGVESVVLRILDTRRIPLKLDVLGFNEIQLEKLSDFCALKNGLVLFTGATGAGKSTTAAAMLMEIIEKNGGCLKVISLENPPEYFIPGVCQIRIDEKINGLDFNTALKYVFRQDPDVIMIGEIRNEASAEAAVRASLTGHLVFGTMHASSAGGAVLRLKNLGIEESLIASVLKGVVSQELQRDENNNEEMELLADVGVVGEEKSGKLAGLAEFTEEDLNQQFEHYTNYLDVIKSGVNRLMHKKLEVKPVFLKKGSKNKRYADAE